MSARRFKAYPEYKDSRADWLGEIPANWEAKRLRRIFRVINGSTPRSAEPDYWNGDIPWVTPEDLGDLSEVEIWGTRRCITEAGYRSCGTSLAPAGSLVLSTRAPIGHLAIAGVTLCTNQGCRSLAYRAHESRRFFFYQLLAARPELESLGQGSTFKELSRGKLEDFRIVEPPQDDQRAIAAFLDRETARIDGLVAKKERLIELLQEQRTALITRAVTKGLDPNAPMKDSGVEWLGEIPAHWNVQRVQQSCSRVTDGAHISPDTSSEDFPFVSTVDIRGGVIDFGGCLRTSASSYAYMERTGCRPRQGDVVFSKDGTVGTTAVVTTDREFAVASSLVILSPNRTQLHSSWLDYWLNSAFIKDEVELLLSGAALRRISVTKVGRLPLLIPRESDEQRVVVTFLDRETAKIDTLITRIRDAIDRLKELRTAMISAAATGKIDVREEVA